eukprot:GHVP01004675.1.p1 GENE.GHVP01004675.1~~GHVP01004675.1.p1  ORF type:complete len:177 (+),score=25.63 GHVP01004675.1:182-712(+)
MIGFGSKKFLSVFIFSVILFISLFNIKVILWTGFKCSTSESTIEENVKLSYIIPCGEKDWLDFNVFLYSLANQTVQPYETIIVFSGKTKEEIPIHPNSYPMNPTERQLPQLEWSFDENSTTTHYDKKSRIERSNIFPPAYETKEYVRNLKVFYRKEGLAGENRYCESFMGFFKPLI